MFEKELQKRLEILFGMPSSMNKPSDSAEQNVLFIEVETSNNTITEAKQRARVTGKLHVYAPQDKLPFGFFSKRINEADPLITKDFFFFAFEENTGTFVNIVERTLSFVFLFDSQYNPRVGTITELTVETETFE